MTRRLLLAAALVLAADHASAQTSELYLTSYQSTQAYVVQNGAITKSFQRTATNDGPALVVQGTVKMYGQAAGGVGREYDYDGNLLAGAYPNPGYVDCYDGATDGARNWTISHNDFGNNFAVIVTDADWGNDQIAFVPQRRSSGITYDATDDTLWITNNVGGSDRVQHYSTAGALLGEFPISMQSGGGYGIALDPADQTLWVPGAFSLQGVLNQYDKSGNLLQSINVPGMNTETLGAEFLGGGPPCNAVVYCDTNPDNAADLTVDSCVCASGSILLNLSGAPPAQFGYAMVGGSNFVVTDPPGAMGDLCLSGGIIGRYSADAMFTDAAGNASLDLLNAVSGGGGGNIPTIGGNLCNPPNQTWNFQWWHRDGMNPSKFSKALTVTFQ